MISLNRSLFLFPFALVFLYSFSLSATQYFDAELPIPTKENEFFIQEQKFYMPLHKKYFSIVDKYKELGLFNSYALTEQQKAAYVQKAVLLREEGFQHLQYAEDVAQEFRDYVAENFWREVMAATMLSIAAGNPYKAALAVATQALTSIEPRIRNFYERINHELYSAEYCFDMSEFYFDVAKNG